MDSDNAAGTGQPIARHGAESDATASDDDTRRKCDAVCPKRVKTFYARDFHSPERAGRDGGQDGGQSNDSDPGRGKG